MLERFLTISLMILGSLAAGYVVRRLGLLPESAARRLMTPVVVFFYPIIPLLALWVTPLRWGDLWLPALAAAQMALLAGLGVALGRLLTKDRVEEGMFALASASPNCGLTMGAFVAYMVHDENGLGISNIYGLMWTPMLVLMLYPLARRYAPTGGQLPLGRLLLRSLFDWRSVGLLMTLAGIVLSPSVLNVPRPALVAEWHVMDILTYSTNIVMYFAIGLQLRASYVPSLRKLIAALALTRHVLGAATGLALAGLTLLTPWPLVGDRWDVFLIQSCVSSAATCVAIAAMFGLRPQQASVLFVANTVTYLAVVLPVILWLFR